MQESVVTAATEWFSPLTVCESWDPAYLSLNWDSTAVNSNMDVSCQNGREQLWWSCSQVLCRWYRRFSQSLWLIWETEGRQLIPCKWLHKLGQGKRHVSCWKMGTSRVYGAVYILSIHFKLLSLGHVATPWQMGMWWHGEWFVARWLLEDLCPLINETLCKSLMDTPVTGVEGRNEHTLGLEHAPSAWDFCVCRKSVLYP